MTVTGPRRPLGTVLIATDFSACAQLALERAARLPVRPGASFDLLHVVPDERDAAAAERMRADAKRLLEAERQSITRTLEAHGNRDRDTLCSVAQGKPFVVIRHTPSFFKKITFGLTALGSLVHDVLRPQS